MQLKFALVALTCAVCGTALAQEARPVPSHGDHMRICMNSEESKQPDGQFGGSVERDLSTAFCQCQYENLPKGGTMTMRQFSDATIGCLNERKADARSFIGEYMDRYNKIRENAAALAELAPVPHGERWRYFGENEEAAYYFDAQNVNWNGRTVTAILKVESRRDNRMNFFKAGIDCDKIEASQLRKLEMRGENVIKSQAFTNPRPEAINPRSVFGELFYTLCLPDLAHQQKSQDTQQSSQAKDVAASVDFSSKNMNPPRYPPAAARAGIEGEVILVIDVDARGNVTNIQVERSSGNNDLDRSAIEAARAWRYKPSIIDGRPAAGRVRIPTNFTLGGG